MSRTEESISMTYVDGYQGSEVGTNKAIPDEENESRRTQVERNVFVIAAREFTSPIFYYIYVALFSLLGCFCRIVIDQLFGEVTNIEDSGRMINQSFVSNILACFILGMLNGSLLADTQWKALYKGLSIGFCGSLSTWSHWNQQLSLVLVDEIKTPSTNQVMVILAYFIGFFSFCGSYSFGKDVTKIIREHSGEDTSVRSIRSWAHVFSAILLIFAVTIFVIVMLLEMPEKTKAIILSLIFAPIAACIRKRLKNIRISKQRFPLGTLTVNVVGAVLVALLHIIVSRLAPYSSCQYAKICWDTIVIYAIEVGFCGTLSTVSDTIAEFKEIQNKNQSFYAYLYIASTLVLSQLFAGVINGINYSYL